MEERGATISDMVLNQTQNLAFGTEVYEILA